MWRLGADQSRKQLWRRNQAWEATCTRFSALHRFSPGLASVMGTMSRPEGDFSFIRSRKEEYNAVVPTFFDLSREVVLLARQLKYLVIAGMRV